MAENNLFIDTNVIIDLLADRLPFSNAAFEIFHKSNRSRWNLYTSSNSIITSFYIIEKNVNSKLANKAIRTILNRVTVQDLNKLDLLNALNSSTADLEDAAQIGCAKKIGKINFIVTRDRKGFERSQIEIISPDELVNTQ
ncbi:PIN domain-containing protein [Cryomorpha ignava]|uniref:PIN domain-containing protein n=1 Tax=Cryomorpha ignava TaxID=101383 RepID=A0A7K3WNM3_9FLAO|nr:PIN domain-containing protein [Cryomorpha ignava]NEN22305.1 PIN domain-containing protein [Cryomorpha ignava]